MGTTDDQTNDDKKMAAMGAIVGGAAAFVCISLWLFFCVMLKFKKDIFLGETVQLVPARSIVVHSPMDPTTSTCDS